MKTETTSMRSNELLHTLIEQDVLKRSETGVSVSITTRFHELVDETRRSLDRNASLRDGLANRFDDPDVVESLAAIGEDDLAFVANYCALATETNSLSHADLVRTVAVLTQIQESVPETDGVPDLFLPVHGDQLPTLLQCAPSAIVYVWRDDCEPCDLMQETFEELFDAAPEDVALFAVYGPENAKVLYDQYNVSGAPATLFMVHGSVDSRLYGSHYPGAIEGEIEKIRERS